MKTMISASKEVGSHWKTLNREMTWSALSLQKTILAAVLQRDLRKARTEVGRPAGYILGIPEITCLLQSASSY